MTQTSPQMKAKWKDTYNWIREINNETEHIEKYAEKNLVLGMLENL